MQYPKHIAIIPDGNRTRAKANGVSVFEWYLTSVQTTVDITTYIFSQTNIDVFTGRWMSTENLKKRPDEETNYLFQLYKVCGEALDEILAKYHVNFKRIGNPAWISSDFLEYLQSQTAKFHFPDSPKTMIFAINYGGRDEILRWVNQWIAQWGTWPLTEEALSANMDLNDIPPVDLVIRTKGDTSRRMSGFMSWWIGYAELYFTPTLYPALTTDEVTQAIQWFDTISHARNFGA
jgi:undecaprenyl diphosphate synthase